MKIKSEIGKLGAAATAFIALLITVHIVSGFILDSFFFSQKRKLTYALEQCTEDIIILGSSRAQHHYNANMIVDSTGLSCYNAGLGGHNIYTHYTILKGVVNRYNPKLVILEINSIDIFTTPAAWNTDKLSIFYPYYNRDTIVREVVDMRSPFEKFKMMSSLVRYNSQLISIVALPLFYNNQEPVSKNRGYIPIENTPHYTAGFDAPKEEERSIDSLKVAYINKTIALCKQHGVDCILTASPLYEDLTNFSLFSEVVNEIARQNQIVFWDYQNDVDFIDATLFKDVNHLNSKGADKFSVKIIKRLEEHITEMSQN